MSPQRTRTPLDPSFRVSITIFYETFIEVAQFTEEFQATQHT